MGGKGFIGAVHGVIAERLLLDLVLTNGQEFLFSDCSVVIGVIEILFLDFCEFELLLILFILFTDLSYFFHQLRRPVNNLIGWERNTKMFIKQILGILEVLKHTGQVLAVLELFVLI